MCIQALYCQIKNNLSYWNNCPTVFKGGLCFLKLIPTFVSEHPGLALLYSRLRYHVWLWYSIWECLFRSWLLSFLFNVPLMHVGRQQKLAHVLGSLLPMRETRMTFLASTWSRRDFYDCLEWISRWKIFSLFLKRKSQAQESAIVGKMLLKMFMSCIWVRYLPPVPVSSWYAPWGAPSDGFGG